MGIAAKVSEVFTSFRAERAGGVAIMVGFMFPVMFIAAGGAVDYTNAVTNTQKAQTALDSAVLQLTRKNLAEIDVQEEGERLFSAILFERGLDLKPFDVTFFEDGDAIDATAMVKNRNYFLNYVGMDDMDAKVHSRAIPPQPIPIEIALVLDVSGSMAQSLNGAPRIERLKEAVNDMFDTLDEELPEDAEVSASLVPYSTSVNLGNFAEFVEGNSVAGTPRPVDGEDIFAAERTVAVNGTDFTLDLAKPGERKFPFVTGADLIAADLAILTAGADPSEPAPLPRPQVATPSARLAPLTDDLDAVRLAVDGMTPNGWTAGHIGMAWGLYSISREWKGVWPQDPEKADRSKKIIVMLSDGEFNTTHAVGDQSFNDGATSDAYFQNVCDLAVAQEVQIYAVALKLDATSEAKLASCVGISGKVYSATSAGELSDAFKDIARRLGQRRLTS